MLKELFINIPLVKVFSQMMRYVKFMKDLVTKKRILIFKLVDNVHHCSAITSHSFVEKKKYLVSFMITCIILSLNFAWALCDLSSSINLIPLAVYKHLGLVFLNQPL